MTTTSALISKAILQILEIEDAPCIMMPLESVSGWTETISSLLNFAAPVEEDLKRTSDKKATYALVGMICTKNNIQIAPMA